jgi:hypothetical protein
MAKFSDYTKFAASFCPNLPALVFKRAMLSASREYFTKTHAWKVVVPLTLVPGKALYDVPYSNDAELIDSIKDVWLEDKFLSPLSREYLTSDTDKGTPRYFSNPSKKTINLYPTPKKSGELNITLTLKPSFLAEEMPDEIFQENFEGLIAGAIFQVKRMAGDWYDPQSAFIFNQEFVRFIEDKRMELMLGNNNSEIFIEYPNFK